MKKKLIVMIIAAMLAVLFAGCAVFEQFGSSEPEPEREPVVNGTSIGNILNYGFGVQYEDDLVFVYTSGDAYAYGNVVRSDPETGSDSLVMESGGLYMSVVDGVMYYCRPDGIYRAAIADPKPELLIEGDAKQLQIFGGAMYFILEGEIRSAQLDGTPTAFAPVENADWLNVYGGSIYYADTKSGHIYRADMDGGGKKAVYSQRVDMFIVAYDIVYFIDSADGYIKWVSIGGDAPQTVVAQRCSGFNVNRSGMYYTRDIGGVGTCCNVGPDGSSENVIAEFGDSEWHVVCMFGEGALVVREEDLEGLE